MWIWGLCSEFQAMRGHRLRWCLNQIKTKTEISVRNGKGGNGRKEESKLACVGINQQGVAPRRREKAVRDRDAWTQCLKTKCKFQAD